MNTKSVKVQGSKLSADTSLPEVSWIAACGRRVSDFAYDFFGKGRDLRVRNLLRREGEVAIRDTQLSLWEQDLLTREQDFDKKISMQFEELASRVASARAVIEEAVLAERRVESLGLQASELATTNAILRKTCEGLIEQEASLRVQNKSALQIIYKAELASVNLHELQLRIPLINKDVQEGEKRLGQLKQEENELSRSIAVLRQARTTAADASSLEKTAQAVQQTLSKFKETLSNVDQLKLLKRIVEVLGDDESSRYGNTIHGLLRHTQEENMKRLDHISRMVRY